MDVNALIQFIEDEAQRFGAISDPGDPNKSYVLRNNARNGYDDDNKAYFGLIEPDELPAGAYHDFSFTVMPGTDELPSLVTICVGSLGFKNDYELSNFPGLRRFFSKIVDKDGFCKSDFSDIESALPPKFANREDLAHLKKTIKEYSPVFSLCQIVRDPLSDDGKQLISAILAGYAKMRNWRRNQQHDRAISEAISKRVRNENTNEKIEITELLQQRRFVVLQGAPGTGKTRMAKMVANELRAAQVFTQFHGETTFSDFVYGIRPALDNETVSYTGRQGALLQAIDKAGTTDGKVVLIIDEINRANLANVLGPVFYLFEYQMDNSGVEIELSPGNSIDKLPPNLYVIATMNTADRSLAVVDFALRRRFAWYTLQPRALSNVDKGTFFKDDFESISEIFHWFATTEELSLQPGHGYFIAANEEEMVNRVRYELFPLVREYLQEGLLRPAKESFNTYFENRIEKSLFE